MIWPKGKKRSEETKARMSASLKGRVTSPETRAKIRAALASPKVRARISAGMRGHKVSKETRAKIGAANARALKGRKLSAETRTKMSAAKKGHVNSAVTRTKMRTVRKKHMIDYNATNCLCGAHRRPQSPTQIENILVDGLLAEFPEVRQEEHFGLYRVDAYLPHPYHLAFEADGAYWHKDHVKRDAERDAYLMREHNLPVIRLSEDELMAMEV